MSKSYETLRKMGVALVIGLALFKKLFKVDSSGEDYTQTRKEKE